MPLIAFRKLRQGLQELAQDYDVVLLDPPPALGTISLAVMQAANALLVPLAATTPDFVFDGTVPVYAEPGDRPVETGRHPGRI
ncbi:MAG: AAA family ATPase [Tepidisphaeraceae bacterium]